MTKEEAKKIIKQFRDRQGNSDEDVEALQMAIKALEQQPNEDAISRDDAIELIAGVDETNGNEPVFSGKQIIKMLIGLPSVTPKALEQQPCEKTISSDSIPREKLETAKKMIKARFMDSGETVMQNETRRAVCREFIKILEEVCG